jgi:energy-coupling factor transporter transmembrane protein EcfT
VPIVVFNLLSVVLASLFFYFETKELVYVKMHVPRKCFHIFISSGVLYIVALLFVFFMTPAVTKISNDPLNMTLPFSLMVGICGFLTLIALGLCRYSKFCIETAIYKRRHGEMLKNQEDVLKQKIDLQNLSDDEIKNKRQEHEDYSSIKTPTSNLVNHVDKEQKN